MFMYYQSNVNECALEIKDGKIFVLYYTLYICIEFSIFENFNWRCGHIIGEIAKWPIVSHKT